MPELPEPNAADIGEKKDALYRIIKSYDRLAVAFSGGVDSTLLLAVAKDVLGGRVTAMTARSPVHAAREGAQAADLANRLGVRHRIVEPDLMADPDFRANGPERCYHCKKVLFKAILSGAADLGMTTLAHGANVDDASDFRPGLRAAAELGVEAPLSQAGLTKADIRYLARTMGLPNWDRPAMACLATRLPYGTRIERKVLHRIEMAEQVMSEFGFLQCRVRCHGDMARIEVGPSEIKRMLGLSMRHKIVAALRPLGFAHIALDLEGYVPGKMNRTHLSAVPD